MDLVDESLMDSYYFVESYGRPCVKKSSLGLVMLILINWFVRGVGVPVSLPSSAPDSTSPSLLPRLGFFTYDGVIDIDVF